MRANNRGLWVALLLMLSAIRASAVVRNITVDENSMAVIHLAMGRSTVLHFHEKPTKVVTGNQNYFNIEFTGNDITVQPLGPITSNLFAYGEYHRYGFILRVSGAEGYDDLVDVRFRGNSFVPRLPPPPEVHEEKKQVSSKNLKLVLNKVFHEKGFHAFELTIQDATGRAIESKNVQLRVLQGQKNLSLKDTVFEKERSDSNEPLKARIFVALPEKSGVTIKVTVNGRSTQLNVPRSSIQ